MSSEAPEFQVLEVVSVDECVNAQASFNMKMKANASREVTLERETSGCCGKKKIVYKGPADVLTESQLQEAAVQAGGLTNAMHEKVEELKSEQKQLQLEMDELRSHNEELGTANDNLQTEVEDLRSRVQNLLEEVRRITEVSASKDDRIRSAEDRASGLEQDVLDLKASIADWQRTQDQSAAALEEANNNRRLLNSEKQEALNTLAAVRSDLVEKTAFAGQSQLRIAALEQQLQEAIAQKEQLAAVQLENGKLTGTIVQQTTTIATLQGQLTSLTADFELVKANLKGAQDAHQIAEQKTDAAQALVNHANQTAHGFVATGSTTVTTTFVEEAPSRSID